MTGFTWSWEAKMALKSPGDLRTSRLNSLSYLLFNWLLIALTESQLLFHPFYFNRFYRYSIGGRVFDKFTITRTRKIKVWIIIWRRWECSFSSFFSFLYFTPHFLSHRHGLVSFVFVVYVCVFSTHACDLQGKEKICSLALHVFLLLLILYLLPLSLYLGSSILVD